MTAAVVVDGLRVVRGGIPVLDGLSLEVQGGTVTGLVGPSGGGKSTLMRALVGVQRVAGGRIEVLGLFPFLSMLVVTSVTILRERTFGTLERLMTMPLAKLDLLAGYAGAFALLAVVQATVVSLLAFGPLGLLVSAFANTEFQAVQFMPAIVLPQFLLCGLFVAREDMATWPRVVSAVLPLTYGLRCAREGCRGRALQRRFALDVAIILGSIALALALGAATLRRRTD